MQQLSQMNYKSSKVVKMQRQMRPDTRVVGG